MYTFFAAPFQYQFWLSLDATLDPAVDYRVPYSIPGSKPYPAPVTVSSIHSLSDSLPLSQDVRQLYCGHVYVIVELDSHSQVVEINNDNNIYAELILNKCPESTYSERLMVPL